MPAGKSPLIEEIDTGNTDPEPIIEDDNKSSESEEVEAAEKENKKPVRR